MIWGFLRSSLFRKAYVLVNMIAVIRVSLKFLVLHVTGLTAFRIIRVSSFSKILLRRDSEYELLVTFTAH